MKEGSCLVNAERPFHVVQCSPQFASFFGYSADELHSRSLRCLNGAESNGPNFEDLIKSFKSDEHQRFNVSAFKKDGSLIRAMVVLSSRSISKEAAPRHKILISLCESYEYINGDEVIDANDKLQDDSIHNLNTIKKNQHRSCNQDHTRRSEASDASRFDDWPDREERDKYERDNLCLVISKASCQVGTRSCLQCTFSIL